MQILKEGQQTQISKNKLKIVLKVVLIDIEKFGRQIAFLQNIKK